MNEKNNFVRWVLSDLMMDLITNTEVFRDITQHEKFEWGSALHSAKIRMVCSSLVINLSKLGELLTYCGKEINQLPESLRSSCLKLRVEIDDKKIYQFRSKYAAHIIDKETKLPLSLVEGERRASAIFGNSVSELNSFIEWVCRKDGYTNGNCVVYTLSLLHDYYEKSLGAKGERP